MRIGFEIPSPHIERPNFLSGLEKTTLAATAVITSVALVAIGVYASALAAVLTGACVLVVVGLCLVKKGMNYYSKMERNAERAQLNLETQLTRSEEELQQAKRRLEQLDIDIEERFNARVGEMNQMVLNAERVTLACCQRLTPRIEEYAVKCHTADENQIVEISRYTSTLLKQDFIEEDEKISALKSLVEDLESLSQVFSNYIFYVDIINFLMQHTLMRCEKRVEQMKADNHQFQEKMNECKPYFQRLKENTRAKINVIDGGTLVRLRDPIVVHDVESNGGWVNFVNRVISYIPPLARAKERAFTALNQWQSASVPQIQRLRDVQVFLDTSQEDRTSLNRLDREVANEEARDAKNRIIENNNKLIEIIDCLFETSELLKKTAKEQRLPKERMPQKLVSISVVENEPVGPDVQHVEPESVQQDIQQIRVPNPNEMD